MEDAKSAELASERRYLDNARDWREKNRAKLEDPKYAEAGANREAQRRLRKGADEELERMQPRDAPAAFGRIDLEDGRVVYVGKDDVRDDGYDFVVMRWTRGEGRLFEQATAEDRCGLSRKRTFTHAATTLIDFEDVVFEDLQARIAELQRAGTNVDGSAPFVSDVLLHELTRARDGEMKEIVRTIQAAQSKIIRAEKDQLLIVQGGPGTGKTAVALHRVSWLIFNYDLDEGDILVIGPNRTFLRYIEKVLPSLGNIRVPQSDVLAQASFEPTPGAVDNDEVARIKGSVLMCAVLERALMNRAQVPAQDLKDRVQGNKIEVSRDAIARVVDKIGSTAYEVLRSQLRDLFVSRVEAARGDPKDLQGFIVGEVNRILPRLKPEDVLKDLYLSRDRLLRAAGHDLTEDQVRSLYRKAPDSASGEEWTPADIPLLDYAEQLISGQPARRYKHIVVDEAQDLSPMQLKMIARRSIDGSMTVVGDIAQSTGLFARSNWDDISSLLSGKHPVVIEDLRYGYRVPRQVFQLAATLLPFIAPDVNPPRALLDAPEDPELLHVGQRSFAELAVQAAKHHSQAGRSVGLICPEGQRDEVENELKAQNVQYTDVASGELGAEISFMAPRQSKGLEFDAIVVIDPDSIAEARDDGYRLLYISLTRTTRYLTIVHRGRPVPVPEV